MAEPVGSGRPERIATAIIVALCVGAAAVIVVSTLRALDRWYLPVPVSDTWEGSFGFTRDAADDFLGALWRPHNEHRIVLSKLLFWFNNTYLGGGNAFLIAVNVVLTAAVAGATAWLTTSMLAGYRAAQWIVGAASVATAFAWMHRQNLVWEFQSQFYFAVLFSLLAMTLAGRAHRRDDARAGYIAAVACAVLALLSMGAGVPTVVALGVVLVVLPAPRRVIVAAGVVLAVALGLYLYGLGETPVNPDVVPFLTEGDVPAPVALVTFLGAPVFWATGSLGWAQVGGAAFLLGSAALVWRVGVRLWRREPQVAMTTAGLGFVLVVLANGLSAALLRSEHGIVTLVSSRYQILVLTGWLVLAVGVAASVIEARARDPRMESGAPRDHPWRPRVSLATALAAVSAAAVLLLVLPAQVASADNPADPEQGILGNPARRTSAALGVELGVPDRSYQMLTLYYRPGAWPALSEYVRERQWAIFGGRFRELRQTLGGTTDDLRQVPCEVLIDSVDPLAEDPGWVVVRGRVSADGEIPELLQFTDPDGVIVGYATPGFFTEQPLSDSQAARYGAFRGYARADSATVLTAGCAWR